MTVRELQEKLAGVDPNAEVFFPDWSSIAPQVVLRIDTVTPFLACRGRDEIGNRCWIRPEQEEFGTEPAVLLE